MSFRLFAFASLALLIAVLSRSQVGNAQLLGLPLPFPIIFPPFTGLLGPWWVFGPSNKHWRTVPQPVAFTCFGGGGNCECPADIFGESGVLINVFPGYQCAFPSGACTWDDKTGALQNTGQANCPSSAPCSTSSGCSCPTDKNGDTGFLINQFTGYQCAYGKGACTWDSDGNLQNTQQTNCVAFAPCKQSGTDS